MRSEAWHPIDPVRLARTGVLATLLILPVLVVDARWHGVTLGAELLGELAVIGLAALLIAAVVALGRRDARTTVAFYLWNLLAMSALTAFVVDVGGDPRRYGVLYGLVMGLAAALFPPRGQLVLQPVAAGSYAIALVASDLSASEIAVQMAIVAVVAGMLVEGCVHLRRAASAEREARSDASRQAGLATALTRLTSLDPDELMDRIVDAVLGLGFEFATIGVVRDGYLVPSRHRGFPAGEEPGGIPADRGLAGRAMTERRTVTVADYLEFDGRLAERRGVRAAVAVPLTSGDEVLGALIGARSTPGELQTGEIEALEVLATHASHAIVNAERFASERRAVARLTEREAMKSDFVSNVSHELRTPLTVIHGVGETLATHGESLDETRRRDLLARLTANSERLGAMISALLDFSRFEAGSSEVAGAPVPLRPAVTAVLARMEPLLERHQLSVAVTDDAVVADARLFEHVIENLVGNAVRHTPPGTCITVTSAREGDEVRISVVDDGPGMPASDVVRVTERFYRGGAAESRPAGGTGLGLALCEQILVAHGSSLEVRSEVGVGTTFSFTLPVAVPASAGGSAV